MTRILGLTAAALVLALAAGCTAADQEMLSRAKDAARSGGQEACAIDQAAQPIIVPVESAIGLAVVPAAPFIAVGHIVARLGCTVILALPATP